MAEGAHPAAVQLPLAIRWNDVVSFEQFVAGANAQALAAVSASAAGEAQGSLYLFGESGCGRSHLLQAACRRCGELGLPAVYLPLGQRAGLSPDLLEGLENMALVALDDLQAVAGSSDWEEALFHLYNRMQESGGCLLLSASGRPVDLGLELADLESRLNWGLVHRLQVLADEDLLSALEIRAKARGLELPADTGRYLISHYPRNAGSLFAMLDRLDLAALSAQRRLTIPFVKQVFDQSR